MPPPDDAIVYDADLAGAYEPGRQLSAAARSVWVAAVGPHLPDAGTVVDIGAGTGRFARLMDAATRSVVAVEPSEAMRRVGVAAAGTTAVRWVAGSAEHVPLAAATADVVWTAFTTHYLDLRPAGRELRRIVRDDGCVLVWHAFPEVFDDVELYRWFPSARGIDERRMPTLGQVAAAFEVAGLELADARTHPMPTAADLDDFADRLAHRAVSTLRLISDAELEGGLARLRRFAASEAPRPVVSANVLATFRPR